MYLMALMAIVVQQVPKEQQQPDQVVAQCQLLDAAETGRVAEDPNRSAEKVLRVLITGVAPFRVSKYTPLVGQGELPTAVSLTEKDFSSNEPLCQAALAHQPAGTLCAVGSAQVLPSRMSLLLFVCDDMSCERRAMKVPCESFSP